MTVIGAYGLGKLLAFVFIWAHDKICPYKPEPIKCSSPEYGLPKMEVIFFDKSFIENLKF